MRFLGRGFFRSLGFLFWFLTAKDVLCCRGMQLFGQVARPQKLMQHVRTTRSALVTPGAFISRSSADRRARLCRTAATQWSEFA